MVNVFNDIVHIRFGKCYTFPGFGGGGSGGGGAGGGWGGESDAGDNQGNGDGEPSGGGGGGSPEAGGGAGSQGVWSAPAIPTKITEVIITQDLDKAKILEQQELKKETVSKKEVIQPDKKLVSNIKIDTKAIVKLDKAPTPSISKGDPTKLDSKGNPQDPNKTYDEKGREINEYGNIVDPKEREEADKEQRAMAAQTAAKNALAIAAKSQNRTEDETAKLFKRDTGIDISKASKQDIDQWATQTARLYADFKNSTGIDLSVATKEQIEEWVNSKAYNLKTGELLHDKLLVEATGVWRQEANDKYGLGGRGSQIEGVDAGSRGNNVATVADGSGLYPNLVASLRELGSKGVAATIVTTGQPIQYRYEVKVYPKIKLDEARIKGYIDSNGLITEEGAKEGYGAIGQRPNYVADLETNTTYIQKTISSGTETRTIDMPLADYQNKVQLTSKIINPNTGEISEISFADAFNKGFVTQFGQVTEEGARAGYGKTGQMALFAPNMNESVTYVREVPVITKTDVAKIQAEEKRLTTLVNDPMVDPQSAEVKTLATRINDWWDKFGTQLAKDFPLFKVVYAADDYNSLKLITDPKGNPALTMTDPKTGKNYGISINKDYKEGDLYGRSKYLYSTDPSKPDTWMATKTACTNSSCIDDRAMLNKLEGLVDPYVEANNGKFPDEAMVNSWKQSTTLTPEQQAAIAAEQPAIITTPEMVEQAKQTLSNDFRDDFNSAIAGKTPKEQDNLKTLYEKDPLTASIIAGVAPDKLKEWWNPEAVDSQRQLLMDAKVSKDGSYYDVDTFNRLTEAQQKVFMEEGAKALDTFIAAQESLLTRYLEVPKGTEYTDEKGNKAKTLFASYDVIEVLRDKEQNPEALKALLSIMKAEDVEKARLQGLKEGRYTSPSDLAEPEGLNNMVNGIIQMVAQTIPITRMMPSQAIPKIDVRDVFVPMAIYGERLANPVSHETWKLAIASKGYDPQNLSQSVQTNDKGGAYLKDFWDAAVVAFARSNDVFGKENTDKMVAEARQNIRENPDKYKNAAKQAYENWVEAINKAKAPQRKEFEAIAQGYKEQADELRSKGLDDLAKDYDLKASIFTTQIKEADPITIRENANKFSDAWYNNLIQITANKADWVASQENIAAKVGASGLSALADIGVLIPAQIALTMARAGGGYLESLGYSSQEAKGAKQSEAGMEFMALPLGMIAWAASVPANIVRDPARYIPETLVYAFGPSKVIRAVKAPFEVALDLSKTAYRKSALAQEPSLAVGEYAPKKLSPESARIVVEGVQNLQQRLNKDIPILQKMGRRDITYIDPVSGASLRVSAVNKIRESDVYSATGDGNVWKEQINNAAKEGKNVEIKTTDPNDIQALWTSQSVAWQFAQGKNPLIVSIITDNKRDYINLKDAAPDVMNLYEWGKIEEGKQLMRQKIDRGELPEYMMDVWKVMSGSKRPELETTAFKGYKDLLPIPKDQIPSYMKKDGWDTAVLETKSPITIEGSINQGDPINIVYLITKNALEAGYKVPSRAEILATNVLSVISDARKAISGKEQRRKAEVDEAIYTSDPNKLKTLDIFEGKPSVMDTFELENGEIGSFRRATPRTGVAQAKEPLTGMVREGVELVLINDKGEIVTGNSLVEPAKWISNIGGAVDPTAYGKTFKENAAASAWTEAGIRINPNDIKYAGIYEGMRKNHTYPGTRIYVANIGDQVPSPVKGTDPSLPPEMRYTSLISGDKIKVIDRQGKEVIDNLSDYPAYPATVDVLKGALEVYKREFPTKTQPNIDFKALKEAKSDKTIQGGNIDDLLKNRDKDFSKRVEQGTMLTEEDLRSYAAMRASIRDMASRMALPPRVNTVIGELISQIGAKSKDKNIAASIAKASNIINDFLASQQGGIVPEKFIDGLQGIVNKIRKGEQKVPESEIVIVKPESNIPEIISDLTDRGGTLTAKLGIQEVGRVDLAVRQDGIMITDINIPKEFQGKGYGEQLQLAVQRLADESGKPLYAGVLSAEGRAFLKSLSRKGEIKLEEVPEDMVKIEGQPVTATYKVSKGEVTPPKEVGKGLAGEEGLITVEKVQQKINTTDDIALKERTQKMLDRYREFKGREITLTPKELTEMYGVEEYFGIGRRELIGKGIDYPTKEGYMYSGGGKIPENMIQSFKNKLSSLIDKAKLKLGLDSVVNRVSKELANEYGFDPLKIAKTGSFRRTSISGSYVPGTNYIKLKPDILDEGVEGIHTILHEITHKQLQDKITDVIHGKKVEGIDQKFIDAVDTLMEAHRLEFDSKYYIWDRINELIVDNYVNKLTGYNSAHAKMIKDSLVRDYGNRLANRINDVAREFVDNIGVTYKQSIENIIPKLKQISDDSFKDVKLIESKDIISNTPLDTNISIIKDEILPAVIENRPSVKIDDTEHSIDITIKDKDRVVGKVSLLKGDNALVMNSVDIHKQYTGKNIEYMLPVIAHIIAEKQNEPLYFWDIWDFNKETINFLKDLESKGIIKLEQIPETKINMGKSFSGEQMTVESNYRIEKGDNKADISNTIYDLAYQDIPQLGQHIESIKLIESPKIKLRGEEGYLDVSRFAPEFQNKAKEIREAYFKRAQELRDQGKYEERLSDPEYSRYINEYTSLSGIDGIIRDIDYLVENVKWKSAEAKNATISQIDTIKNKVIGKGVDTVVALNEAMYLRDTIRNIKDSDTMPIYRGFNDMVAQMLYADKEPSWRSRLDATLTAKDLIQQADAKALQTVIDAKLGIREKQILYNRRMVEELDNLMANMPEKIDKKYAENVSSQLEFLRNSNISLGKLREIGRDDLANLKDLQEMHDVLYKYVDLLKGQEVKYRTPSYLEQFAKDNPNYRGLVSDAVTGKLSNKRYRELISDVYEYYFGEKITKESPEALKQAVNRYNNYKKAVADVLLDKDFELRWSTKFDAYRSRIEALKSVKDKVEAERIRSEATKFKDDLVKEGERKQKAVEELRDYREIPYKAKERIRYPYIPMRLAREGYAVPVSVEEARTLPYYKAEERAVPVEYPKYEPITTEYKPAEYVQSEYKPIEEKRGQYGGAEYKPIEYKPIEYKTITTTGGMRAGTPIKIGKKRAEDLTDFEKASMIAWKQGIMYRGRYYPYRFEDMINTRKPIEGVKYYEGPESAYKSVVMLYPGKIPAEMDFNMGLFVTHFDSKSDSKGGKSISVAFTERPEQAKHEQRLSKKEREEMGLPPKEEKKERVRKLRPVIEEAEEIVEEKQTTPVNEKILPMPPEPPMPPRVTANDIMGQPSYNEVRNGKIKVTPMEERKPSPTLSILNL